MKNFIKAKVKPLKDLSGRLFGTLFVIKPVGRRGAKTVYECRCEACGKYIKSTSDNIQRKQACGCLKGGVVTHGMSGSIEHVAWSKIKNRCLNQKDRDYHKYGGRGITVCDRWLEFKNFFSDMGNRPENKESIDRINNKKGYSPDNCRWADRKQQNRNKRNNVYLTHNNKTYCVGEWAERLGLSARLLTKRLATGMTIERAFKNINLLTGKPLKALT